MLATWKQGRPLLPAVIVISCLIGLVTSANGVSTYIQLEGPPGTVTVCQNFDVTLTIGHAQNNLGSFLVIIRFDSTQVEYKEAKTTQGGWSITEVVEGAGSVAFSVTATGDQYIRAPGYHKMLVITFHCLGPGTSTIRLVPEPEAHPLYTSPGFEGSRYTAQMLIDTDEFTQVEAKPVGGVVVSTSKLEILTPYLALAGLVIAVSAVVIVKKRR